MASSDMTNQPYVAQMSNDGFDQKPTVSGDMVVGVIGATGAVGVEMLDVLHTRKFPSRS